MNTKHYKKEDINEIASCIIKGEVIAFPTDTVFGLGVIYENEDALEALKLSKGRPENKPIPTMVCSLEQIEKIAHVSEMAKKLIQAFMPGAFTIILKKREELPDYLTNGFDTVGIRMPEDDFVLELISKCGKPMLVTSANLSGEEPGQTDIEVLKQLDGRIHGIVEGCATGGIASTIVDMSGEEVTIVREGPIDKEMMDNVLLS
ncbi:MAG: L-threonylcarbamoyladenylate synthase [Longicatena sp.]